MGLLSFLMLLPGPILFLIYKKLVSSGILEPLVLYDKKLEIATMASSFAYTMLGFVATIITILFVFTKAPNYEAYKRSGYLDMFFVMYFLTIISLLITAFLSLYGFSPKTNYCAFNFLMMSFTNNIFNIFVVTLVLCNIARKSA